MSWLSQELGLDKNPELLHVVNTAGKVLLNAEAPTIANALHKGAGTAVGALVNLIPLPEADKPLLAVYGASLVNHAITEGLAQYQPKLSEAGINALDAAAQARGVTADALLQTLLGTLTPGKPGEQAKEGT